MKILLLHDGQGKKIAGELLKQIKKQRIDGEILLLQETWESIEPHLGETLADATHILAIFSGSSISSPSGPSWFAFAAGCARGAQAPLLSYGEGALALEPKFVKELIHLKGDAEFSAYLIREAEDWTREHAIKQALETLLERGIPVTVDALARCISEKNDDVISLFLQAGFSPNTLDKTGVPLLCLAARAGDREITALLLKNGASVDLLAHDRGGSALIDAALGKYADILGDLLKAGADANVKSKDGQSGLIIAVGLNDEPTVALLLKAGANVDEPDSLGASARKYAALFNKPGMVRLFKTYAPPASASQEE